MEKKKKESKYMYTFDDIIHVKQQIIHLYLYIEHSELVLLISCFTACLQQLNSKQQPQFITVVHKACVIEDDEFDWD